MANEVFFTLKIEPELLAEFMAEADLIHRPASQILGDLMREFIQTQREAGNYDEFLKHKVEASRASMLAEIGDSNEDVELLFAKRRAENR
jgi:hypothetical protein